MSDEHNADGAAEAKDLSSVNRRRFVKALGGTGVLGVSGVTGSAQAQPSENNLKREVNEVAGSTQQKFISTALSDTRVKAITENIKQSGWGPHTTDATVNRVDKADEDSDLDFGRYHVVSIPFRKTTGHQYESESGGIIWTDKSLESVGFTTPMAFKIEGDSGNGSSIAPEDSGANYPVATEYTMESGEVVADRTVVESGLKLADKKSVTTQSCYCETQVVECDSVPWWCWLSLAASYAGTYWACGACGLGAWFACGKCLVAIGGGVGSSVGCVANHDCRDVTVCRSRDQVDRKPCRICSNIWHPNCW